MATTIPTAAAQVGNGRTPHRVRKDGFHLKALCTRTVTREYTPDELAKLGDFCKGCEKAYAALLAETPAVETPAEEAPAVEVAEVAAAPAPVADEETPARTPAVHYFDSTESAYNETQSRDDIHDGDVLVVETAKVVGFLDKVWPAAITVEFGELHRLAVPGREYEDGAYAASVDLAEQLANELGFDVDPLHATPAAVADEETPACAAPEQPAQDAERFTADVETRLAYPGHSEDRLTVYRIGHADPVQYIALPRVASRSARTVLAAFGWELVDGLEYLAGINLERGPVRRVEPADTPEAEELRAAVLRQTTAMATAIGDNPHARHFQAVMPAEGSHPIGWTYRNTGFGENSLYAWVTAQGRGTDRVGVPTREDAERMVRDWHTAGKDVPTDTGLVDVIAELPADELGKAAVTLRREDESMSATFTEGDRVLCVDGLVRTATGTEIKDGKAWVHMEDRSAWPVNSSELIDTSRVETATADALRAATTLRATAAAPDPAALTELGDALRYLRQADPAAHAALIEGADRIAVRIPRADLAPGDVLHDQGAHDVLDVCTIAMDTKAPAWWALILGHTEEVRSYTGREPWATASRLDLARTDEVSVDRPLPGASPVPAPFAAGDRVVCADGTAHTVREMAPIFRNEPARVVVEDGTEWIAENCRRANPRDVSAALAESSRLASIVATGADNLATAEWKAALAELVEVHAFLKIADPIIRAALAEGEAKAAVLAIHADAHTFQPFFHVGDPVTVGWSFRTGHGSSARYGIVTTGATISPVGLYEYRTTAERAHLYADRRFTAAPVTG